MTTEPVCSTENSPSMRQALCSSPRLESSKFVDVSVFALCTATATGSQVTTRSSKRASPGVLSQMGIRTICHCRVGKKRFLPSLQSAIPRRARSGSDSSACDRTGLPEPVLKQLAQAISRPAIAMTLLRYPSSLSPLPFTLSRHQLYCSCPGAASLPGSPIFRDAY